MHMSNKAKFEPTMPRRTADLEDLYKELWLRERERGNIVWETRYGTKVPINRMSDQHLINTIKMLEHNEEMMDHIGDMDPLEYYD